MKIHIIITFLMLMGFHVFAQPKLPDLSVNRGSWRSIIMPKDDVRISPQADGVIVAYPIEEGQRIKAGEIVVILDDRMEKVELSSTQATLRRALAEREKVRKDFERIDSLFHDKIASEKQYYDTKAALEAGEAFFIQAEQAVERAKILLDYRYLKSPVDGLFFKKTKSVGEALNRYEVAARIIEDSSLEMLIYASPQYFGSYKIGDVVTVQLLDGPHAGDLVPATVLYVDPLLDPASGTFRIKLQVMPSDKIYPGLAALVDPEAKSVAGK